MSKYIQEYEMKPVRESNCDQLLANNVIHSVFIERNDVFRKYGGLHGVQRFCVVYAISDGRGWYIGSTDDFGQRITTHLTQSRDKFKRLQRSIRETGKMYVRILGVYGDMATANAAEKDFICGYKVHVVKNIIGLPKWRTMREPLAELRKYCYCISPIINYERLVKQHY